MGAALETAYRIYVWNAEKVFCPPATRDVPIEWTGRLRKAQLRARLSSWRLTGVEVNGNLFRVDGQDVLLDVTRFIIKGVNTFVLHYEAPWWCVFPWDGDTATVYVDIEVEGEVRTAPPRQEMPWYREVMIWGFMTVVGATFAYGLATSLPRLLERRGGR